jgi:hypothetical protein
MGLALAKKSVFRWRKMNAAIMVANWCDLPNISKKFYG